MKCHLNGFFFLILRFFKHLALQFKHISSTPKLFNIHTCHPLICITQSEKTLNKANETWHRLGQTGYPLRLLKKILTVRRQKREALCNKAKQTKEILSFVTIYNPATLNLKKNLMKHRHIIQQQPKLKQIFNQLPIVSHRKKKSLNDILVRAKISIISQQSQNQQTG